MATEWGDVSMQYLTVQVCSSGEVGIEKGATFTRARRF